MPQLGRGGLVPAGGHILDAGCGPWRDAAEFRRRGYRVTAFDASPEMARMAPERTGEPVAVLRFQELTYQEQFDGVWACASLVHVPRVAMDEVFCRLTRALRAGGAWYMSFKRGEGEEMRDGRLFNDSTDSSFAELLKRYPRLVLLRTWQTEDLRPERCGQYWLNALVQK